MTAKTKPLGMCKTPNCKGHAAPYKRCAKCRKQRAAQTRRWQDRNRERLQLMRAEWKKNNLERWREKNRQRAKRYYNSQAPKAIAYKKRQRKRTNELCKAWNKRNEAHRRAKQQANDLLQKAIAAKKVKKPKRCQVCNQKKRLIANNLRIVRGKPKWDKFVCWSCWWELRRT